MFLWIAFAMALVLTVVVCCAFPNALPFSLLILLGLFVGSAAFLVVILFIISLFYPQSRPAKKDDPFCRFLAYHTMEAILAVFRFRVTGKGLERLPEKPCVLICNHLSRFDPMATTLLMKKRQIAFVSKKENMRIPIVGNVTHNIGYLALDRENPLRAMRTIHTAARLVSEKGYTMGIYPEGTRSKSGELLEFKTGAFVMAKKASAPIVVCSIQGTDEYKKNLPFHSTPVTFEVLTVISEEDVNEKKPEELATLCRSIILNHQDQ